jgi:hypothetical protein
MPVVVAVAIFSVGGRGEFLYCDSGGALHGFAVSPSRPSTMILGVARQKTPDTSRPIGQREMSASNAAPTSGVSNLADLGSQVPGRRQRQVRSKIIARS